MQKISYEAERCIKVYLAEHDGTAPAGDVTAHAIAAGFASSTIRRVADRVVNKRREGNSFAWSLRPRITFAPLAPEPTPPREDSPVGRMVDTSRPLSMWDAQRFNGERHELPTYVAPVEPPIVEQDDPSAADTDDPEFIGTDNTNSASTMDSRYARMSQAERLHLIELRHGPDDYTQLTEVEAVVWLEQEDDPATSPRAHRSSALPF